MVFDAYFRLYGEIGTDCILVASWLVGRNAQAIPTLLWQFQLYCFCGRAANALSYAALSHPYVRGAANSKGTKRLRDKAWRPRLGARRWVGLRSGIGDRKFLRGYR